MKNNLKLINFFIGEDRQYTVTVVSAYRTSSGLAFYDPEVLR